LTVTHWFDAVAGQKIFGPELPDYETLISCVRCARCLPVCPTYRETLNEIQSPRGRLALIRAVEDGRLELSSSGVEEHLYHCLDCRACNTVCPAGIPIGEVIVSARAAIAEKSPRPKAQTAVLDFFFARPARLEAVFFWLRIYQRLGLERIARRMPLSPALKAMSNMLPALSRPLRQRLGRGSGSSRTGGHERTRVGFFINCVMNVAYADSSAATIRLLERLGCEVVAPTNIGCCGAPQEDQGARATTRAFAKRLIAAFEPHDTLSAIVTDSAGCGSMLKEYGHLLKDDPQWAERAQSFSAKVRDSNEFLAARVKANPPAARLGGSNRLAEVLQTSAPPRHPRQDRGAGRLENASRLAEGPPPSTLPLSRLEDASRLRVTYHDPCHLLNTQKVKTQPREMLCSIPWIDLVELPDSNWCCGSAGIYNITHPAMSQKVLQRKIDAIASTGASVLVTANPGCLMQIRMGLAQRGLPVRVMHISELLEQAYRQGED
jgi:glycolate oxidase iron-sulfur subunit